MTNLYDKFEKKHPNAKASHTYFENVFHEKFSLPFEQLQIDTYYFCEEIEM